MQERLVKIAATSLFVCVVSLTLAAWTGGVEHAGRHWWRWADLSCKAPAAGDTKESSIKLGWETADRLDIDLPADVRYRPGPQGEALISGPAWLVQHVRLAAGRLAYDAGFDCAPADGLTVELTGPAVTDWRLRGSGRLNLEGVDQERLDIHISGSGELAASGTAGTMALRISGSGRADMAKLALKSADLHVSGSGDADIAPQEEADIKISGSGNVTVHGHPTRLQSHISGSGKISEAR